MEQLLSDNNLMSLKFSVLMSVYKNDNPEYFKTAIESVINQTVKPTEIVLVRDGMVADNLQETINEIINEYGGLINYIPLEQNGGLGNALKIGVEKAKYNLIARMDSDDYSLPNRFELQLKAFIENVNVDVVGGQIEEFDGDINDVVGRRNVPLTHLEIVKYMKMRSPFNHPTVMFKKSAVENCGNYIEMHYVEDYYLWCRMFLSGAKFMNLKETLVKMRVNKETYMRRGGRNYFKSQKTLDKFKKEHKIIGFFTYIKNICVRYVQCVLMPNKVRAWAYSKILNRKVSG